MCEQICNTLRGLEIKDGDGSHLKWFSQRTQFEGESQVEKI